MTNDTSKESSEQSCRLLIVDRKEEDVQRQFKLNLSEKTDRKTNLSTSRYSSNAATKATTTDCLAKENKRKIAPLLFEQPKSNPKHKLRFVLQDRITALLKIHFACHAKLQKLGQK